MFKVISSAEEMPSLDSLIQEINEKAQGKIGLVFSYTGIVREYSRNGTKVKGVRIKVDRDKLAEIIEEAQKLPGIFEVRAFVREGELKVGDYVMRLVGAGDFRDNVINSLTNVLNQIKESVTYKEEIPA
ncbi:molybdopterin biosynthesis MoaE protein [Thermodesulfatator indicus DSM 15286]|uniref:Molybdopterin synthase catalytic subunit n=1 Tax=Thermodesulfatator indicus (strain DSM 15286 / JCM 11887 / CIR29812) TaxID=667014 RepID=F8A9B4_THEID|nr:molybdenum cofactor biosynthesis protein MoaE [Thermodesulfatator indicus]AEH45561.1 molybdopterin biosynthesis MoaE protein [Thermodesulfatator indicus DSM 15286]